MESCFRMGPPINGGGGCWVKFAQQIWSLEGEVAW